MQWFEVIDELEGMQCPDDALALLRDAFARRRNGEMGPPPPSLRRQCVRFANDCSAPIERRVSFVRAIQALWPRDVAARTNAWQAIDLDRLDADDRSELYWHALRPARLEQMFDLARPSLPPERRFDSYRRRLQSLGIEELRLAATEAFRLDQPKRAVIALKGRSRSSPTSTPRCLSRRLIGKLETSRRQRVLCIAY